MTYTGVGFSLQLGFKKNSIYTVVGSSPKSGFTKVLLTALFPLPYGRGDSVFVTPAVNV